MAVTVRCYEPPHLADYLSELVGIHISMMKVYLAGAAHTVCC